MANYYNSQSMKVFRVMSQAYEGALAADSPSVEPPANSLKVTLRSHQQAALAAYVLGIVSYGLVNPKAIANADKLSATNAFFKYLLSDACVNSSPDLGFSTISGQVLTTVNGLIAKIQ